MSDISEGQNLLQTLHCLRPEYKECITNVIEDAVQYRQNVIIGNVNATPGEVRINPYETAYALHVTRMHKNATVTIINALMELFERMDERLGE